MKVNPRESPFVLQGRKGFVFYSFRVRFASRRKDILVGFVEVQKWGSGAASL